MYPIIDLQPAEEEEKPALYHVVEELVWLGRIEEANQMAIILKTAMIYEQSGIVNALAYYDGKHDDTEYQKIRTEIMQEEE